MTEDIHEALHRAAELLPDTPDRLGSVRRRHTSLRRRRTTAAAAAVLALAGGGTALGLTRTGDHAPSVVQPGGPGGTEYEAKGEVVQVGNGPVKLCAPVPQTLILITPRPAPGYCSLGIEARGVDMSRLDNRFEKDGAVSGDTSVRGYVDGDVLVVTEQGGPVDDQEEPQFTSPPCTAPPGGWPATNPYSNPDTTALTDYRNSHPDTVAEVAIARPTATTYGLYVLTYGDPQVVYDALRPTYGEKLCVARSTWTRAEVQSAASEFRDHRAAVNDLGVYVSFDGGSLQPDGQLVVVAKAARSNAGLEAIKARHPAGLIRIDYWLHPVS